MDRSVVTGRKRADWKEPVVRGAGPVVMLHLYKYSYIREILPQAWGGRVRCMGHYWVCGWYRLESSCRIVMLLVTMVTVDGSWVSV